MFIESNTKSGRYSWDYQNKLRVTVMTKHGVIETITLNIPEKEDWFEPFVSFFDRESEKDRISKIIHISFGNETKYSKLVDRYVDFTTKEFKSGSIIRMPYDLIESGRLKKMGDVNAANDWTCYTMYFTNDATVEATFNHNTFRWAFECYGNKDDGYGLKWSESDLTDDRIEFLLYRVAFLTED